jgi:Tol biopolymer transport system component
MSELRIITKNHDGRVLTNNNVWTSDSRYLLYDTRSDRLGDIFDGTRIMQIDVTTGDEQCIFMTRHGAGCGVVTTHPFDDRFVFIAGPEHPTRDWSYGPSHRQGMIGHRASPHVCQAMDARDVAEKPVRGALRGGTHVHMWHPKGDWLRSTYNDALVAPTVRDIAVHLPGTVDVSSDHSRNQNGNYHSFIVTDTVVDARSEDHITRAYEETWMGSSRKIAFMADTVVNGQPVTEIFLVDASSVTLGSVHKFDTASRIKPPAGVMQRRLTHFAGTPLRISKKPRHWLVSSPDGSELAVLLQRNDSPPQVYTLDIASLKVTQRTFIEGGVRTVMSWSANGDVIAFGSGTGICLLDTDTWKVRLQANVPDESLLPLCCCISPDAKHIAVQLRDTETNHIGIVAIR